MSDAPICEFSDLPTDACEHCQPRSIAEAKPLRTGAIIVASYTSDCGWCGHDMEEAVDRIAYTEECGWVHVGCADEPDGPRSTPDSMWGS